MHCFLLVNVEPRAGDPLKGPPLLFVTPLMLVLLGLIRPQRIPSIHSEQLEIESVVLTVGPTYSVWKATNATKLRSSTRHMKTCVSSHHRSTAYIQSSGAHSISRTTRVNRRVDIYTPAQYSWSLHLLCFPAVTDFVAPFTSDE